MATFLGLDYPTLWFLVVGALFSGYAILDGFDFGAGAWHLFFEKEEDRRIALNAVGPVWDGNEVWLVIGGGALFAGFPVLYATLFSSMYIPFILFLMFIIFRAISIEFRGKEKMLWWKRTWDIGYSVSSIMLAFLLGVVLGNVLQGISFGENYQYFGDGFLEFLNPYAILTGLTSLSSLLKIGIIFFIISYALTTLYTLIFIPHLSDAFITNPLLFGVPALTFLSIANLPRLASQKKYKMTFLFSSITISLLLIVVAIELYPTLLISTVDQSFNIDIYNAASSDKSLGIMLLFVVIGTPLIIGYTLFVYKTFWGKVKLDETSY